MGLPKSTEENIEVSKEDLKSTEHLKDITTNINSILDKQENEVTRFVRHFQSVETWLSQNIDSRENFRDLLLDKVGLLQDHAEKSIGIIENIKSLTVNVEKEECRKIMLKSDLDSDFTFEKANVKELRYPFGVVSLAKDITRHLEKTKDRVSEDLSAVKRSEELLDNVAKIMKSIQDQLTKLRDYVLTSSDLSTVQQDLLNLVNGIKTELVGYQRLSQFEKLHLHLLLELYDEEQDTVREETRFADDENKYQE